MAQFAPEAFDLYQDRLVVTMREIEEETQLVQRFRVPGSPTFVLLDPTGQELTRFFFQPDAVHLVDRLSPFLGTPAKLPERRRPGVIQ